MEALAPLIVIGMLLMNVLMLVFVVTDASKRGKSAFVWGLIAFLLGPIGWLWWLLARPAVNARTPIHRRQEFSHSVVATNPVPGHSERIPMRSEGATAAPDNAPTQAEAKSHMRIRMHHTGIMPVCHPVYVRIDNKPGSVASAYRGEIDTILEVTAGNHFITVDYKSGQERVCADFNIFCPVNGVAVLDFKFSKWDGKVSATIT